MRVAVGLLVGCLWLLSEIGAADACACCDGAVSRKVMSWSKSGKSVLFRTTGYHSCERYDYFEIVRQKASEQSGCYDLARNPNKRIDCNDVDFHPHDAKLKKSLEAKRWFPTAATRLPADVVRARRGKDKVEVEVFAGGAWQRVWTGNAATGIDGEGVETIENPISIYPSPTTKMAVLLIDNDVQNNGNGADSVSHFQWVELPAAVASGADTANENAWIPVPTFRKIRAKRAASRARNRRGLRMHNKKDYGAAIADFVDALTLDPANPMARYNLACSYALLGLRNHAIGQLEILKAANCKKCPARIERARVDEDLASLRGDVRFKQLIAK